LKAAVLYARAAALAPCADQAMRLVTPARREKAARLRLKPDRYRSLAAGLLVRRFLGVRDDTELTYGPMGRPELSTRGPFFSLSHAGDFAALALLGEVPVGLDLEPLSRRVRRGLVAERIFSAEERELMAGSPDDPELFLAVWTRKESLLKAAGMGLFQDPEDFSAVPLDAPALPALGSLWSFSTFVEQGHVFSVAAPAEGGALEIETREVPVEELLE
jgi:4'-phosphopantetheinyl transferase